MATITYAKMQDGKILVEKIVDDSDKIILPKLIKGGYKKRVEVRPEVDRETQRFAGYVDVEKLDRIERQFLVEDIPAAELNEKKITVKISHMQRAAAIAEPLKTGEFPADFEDMKRAGAGAAEIGMGI